MAADISPEELLKFGDHLDEYAEEQKETEDLMRDGSRFRWTKRDWLIEKYLKIRPKAKYQAPLELNRAQQEYSLLAKNKNIVLKARQVGITTYVAARFFVQTITRPGTLSMQVTHDRESAEHIFRIVRRFWDNLPEEWRKGKFKTSHCNTRQLVFPDLDSEYCLAAADENAGRGRTIQNLHCSEVARWGARADEALASLRGAVVPDGDIVLESTARGARGVFYEEWQRAEETGYQQHFFPWWYDDLYVLEPGADFGKLTDEEAELAAREGLTNAQIAWRRNQWASMRTLAAQEFAEDPVSCFKASGDCVFVLDAIEEALRRVTGPWQTEDNGQLLRWLPPQPTRQYVIGADPAGGGVDGDYSCAEVIDRELGTQCVELRGHFAPREFAQKLIELGKEYNTACLAVERNNHGHAVLVVLNQYEYPNIYKYHGKDGWDTNPATRPRMIEDLGAILLHESKLLQSERLLNEMRTFERDALGNTSAVSGAHDDCVMAMAIAYAARADSAGKGTKAAPSEMAPGDEEKK